MSIRPECSALAGEMTLWRRHLHAHPETAYKERETSDYVANLLKRWGYEVVRGVAGTGLVATMTHGRGSGKLGLRADMDALDVHEDNTFEYASKHTGKMHACGHDGHMAMLLGAAQVLAREKRFDGTLRLIFQPAEEIQPANAAETGAQRMVSEGIFEKFPVDAVYAMHNMPFLPEGQFVVRDGPMMASSDVFEIIIRGSSVHAAWPHNGRDAISIAAALVQGLNHISSRTIDPVQPAVISVTQIHAGDTTNVLPESVKIVGTTRAFRSDIQDHIEMSMRGLCEGYQSAYGTQIDLVYERRCPPTINDRETAGIARLVAAKVVGPENVSSEHPPAMGGEDFAWMLRAKRGSYVWLGTNPPAENASPLHNTRFDFNDRVLPIGATFWVELAEHLLAREVA